MCAYSQVLFIFVRQKVYVSHVSHKEQRKLDIQITEVCILRLYEKYKTTVNAQIYAAAFFRC